MRNHQHRMKYFLVVCFAFFITVLATSCGSVKNMQYLQGSFDTAKLSTIKVPEPIVQKGDLLGITIYSDDPLATAAVTRQSGNQPAAIGSESGSGISSSAAASGYLVNQQGDLLLYKLGIVHAEGLSKQQLADTISYLYTKQDLLKNPFVEVRFLNYKITVIGEVNKPGSYAIPADKVSAFEAIGLAGDITVYGRRDNVLVVREINGVRQFGKLNLRDPNVFLSPYYYLQQNDMVVVDVGKAKGTVNNQSTLQAISIGTSFLSIAAVFISIFRR